MALNPQLVDIATVASEMHRDVEPLATPNTFIPDDRFHALIERLKGIDEANDEARDKAITVALLEVAGVAPASWQEIYKRNHP